VPACYCARPRIPHVEKKPLNRPQKLPGGKKHVVATCSESGSNPSSRVLYLRLHLLPLEPLVGAILVVQLYPARKATARSPWRQLDQHKSELRIERRMRTQSRRRMRTGHTTARSTLFHHI
jgi:hypothetical protein